MELPTPEEWKEALPDFHWKPDRAEFLANAISEIDLQISKLLRIKAHYEVELEEIVKKK